MSTADPQGIPAAPLDVARVEASTAQCVAGWSMIVLLLVQLNLPLLTPQAALAIFLGIGLGLVFCLPAKRLSPWLRWIARALGVLSVLACARIAWESQPLTGGDAVLGNRVGSETPLDLACAVVVVFAVLIATWWRIGWPLVVLALLAMGYALAGPVLPDWLLAHRGTPPLRLINQLGLHEQGVFGVAISVMFTSVALFVLLGVLLQACGAISFMIGLAQRWFGQSPGGMAKIAVVGSGLMGSLSGSAVANTAATGAFSIPLMRASGFTGVQAAAIEAVASSGGALVPPVMGAAAYLMLEIIQPPVTLLTIMRAAIIPAILYYLSLFLIVDFSARRRMHDAGANNAPPPPAIAKIKVSAFAGVVFFAAVAALVTALISGLSPSRSATIACVLAPALAFCHPSTRPAFRVLWKSGGAFARDLAPLLLAAACAGIIIGVLTMTGGGTRIAGIIMPLMDQHILLALLALMVVSLLLGLGLPPLVCYLLMTSLLGAVIAKLGVPALAAHFFIFYFGMLSMITPPVALAAFAAAGIAGAPPMAVGFQAIRFGWITFLIPFLFVFRPEILLLEGTLDRWPVAMWTTFCAICGIAAFAAGTARYALGPLGRGSRILIFIAACVMILPAPPWLMMGPVPIGDLAGLILAAVIVLRSRQTKQID